MLCHCLYWFCLTNKPRHLLFFPAINILYTVTQIKTNESYRQHERPYSETTIDATILCFLAVKDSSERNICVCVPTVDRRTKIKHISFRNRLSHFYLIHICSYTLHSSFINHVYSMPSLERGCGNMEWGWPMMRSVRIVTEFVGAWQRGRGMS